MRRGLAGQPEIGRRDTVFDCCYLSGTCWTISIFSPGAIGSPRHCSVAVLSGSTLLHDAAEDSALYGMAAPVLMLLHPPVSRASARSRSR